ACQPASAPNAARVQPQFTATRYGRPAYCQLALRGASELLTGSDDGSEMGAFHHLFAPQRETNVTVRLDEYLRFGLEAGILYASGGESTMKGDFDRVTFDPRKHYAGVRSQQGRVATAADWNEQGEIVRRRIRIEARDVIGPCGGPEDDCGFAITVSGKALTIGAGRYYVDGILCEDERDGVPYEQQPDYPSPPDWLAGLGNTPYAPAVRAVWGRHVTALDYPRLREVALGGPDTDTRLKRVWQVKILPLAVTGSTGDLAALQAKRAALAQKRA